MEWILVIILLLVCFCFMFLGEETTSSKKQSRSVAVKNFIDNEKTYTLQESVQTIYDFIIALGDTDEYQHSAHAEEVALSFPKLLTKLKNEYRAELEGCEKEIVKINEHWQKAIDETQADPELDREDKKEEIAGIKADLKEELKSPKKTIKWCEKQISAIEENPRPILKKILGLIKKEHLDDNPILDLDDDHFFQDIVKEPPF